MNGAAAQWLPYCGAAPTPAELLDRWNFDPLLIVGIAAISCLIFRQAQTVPERRRLFVTAGLALVLFVSPFCALSSALFSARVTHHVVLSIVLAPLLVFALPACRTSRIGALHLWTGGQAAVFWLWHEPSFYAAALSSDVLYWLMQSTIVGTAFGFWAALRHSSGLSAVAALLFSTVQMGLLGALITFAGAPLYAPHFLATAPWGLAAIEDQQLAGLIMWAPSAGLYLGAALFVAQRWLKREFVA